MLIVIIVITTYRDTFNKVEEVDDVPVHEWVLSLLFIIVIVITIIVLILISFFSFFIDIDYLCPDHMIEICSLLKLANIQQQILQEQLKCHTLTRNTKHS